MDRIPFEDLQDADLIVDTVYSAGPQPNLAADPIGRLLPVGNQGGFRFNGSLPLPELVVLYSTGGVPGWPDHLDQVNGRVTYFGDNRRPGHGLLDTPKGGNRILRATFDSLNSPEERSSLPVFLYFEAVEDTRDAVFRGLLAPGAPDLSPEDSLSFVWRSENGRRFQNFRSTFTILDAAVIPRVWLSAALSGKAMSGGAPPAWTHWTFSGEYQALEAPDVNDTPE